VQQRADMVGLDASILMHPTVWKASGHVDHFTDPMVDCRECKRRFRADQVDEMAWIHYCEATKGNKFTIAGGEACKHCGARRTLCPECGRGELTAPRLFNLMFKTFMGPVEEDAAVVFMRPETAQGMFVNFLNAATTSRKKIPFGIAQIGKSFRNEITPGNFLFRTREFEQMEMEFFVKPGEDERWFEYWVQERFEWYARLGIKRERLRLRPHAADELAHYAKGCADVEYEFPFGWSELEGIANRTDFDLKQHAEYSGKDLSYYDDETKERYVPYVIEPAAGADRATLAFLVDAYDEEEIEGELRVVLHFHPRIAPVKAAVLPLMRKDGQPEKAREVYDILRQHWVVQYDQAGAIGRRYRRQDEIGTPFGVTVDHQTMADGTVTLRDRDTMQQERMPIDRLVDELRRRIEG
jgi:glycyl-tRNA synthetase